jgi:hypothetical protein
MIYLWKPFKIEKIDLLFFDDLKPFNQNFTGSSYKLLIDIFIQFCRICIYKVNTMYSLIVLGMKTNKSENCGLRGILICKNN